MTREPNALRVRVDVMALFCCDGLLLAGISVVGSRLALPVASLFRSRE